ncbi:MAG: toxin HicA [Acidobacteria bacterium]|nr:toxin HicA [Acidobacteriota bacterium]
MASVDKILVQLQNDPTNARFADLLKLCEAYFGEPRHTSGSHVIFKMPWPGDPRVNIQNDHGKAKAYQVRQVLAAIDKLTNSKEHKR